LLLIAGIIMTALEIYTLWSTNVVDVHVRPQGKNDVVNGKNVDSKDLPFDLKNLKSRLGPKEDYNAMSEKNLFSADRRGQILEPESQQQKAREDESQPVGEQVPVELYGIIWTETQQAALINNPYAETIENSNKWFKPGDSVGGGAKGDEISVMEIYEDHVILTIDGKSRELYLYKKKNEQEVVATVKNGGNSGLQNQQQNQKQPEQKQPTPPETGEISEDGRYRIFETPFGKIKRRIN
jgi:hypothetical protein